MRSKVWLNAVGAMDEVWPAVDGMEVRCGIGGAVNISPR